MEPQPVEDTRAADLSGDDDTGLENILDGIPRRSKRARDDESSAESRDNSRKKKKKSKKEKRKKEKKSKKER